MKKVLFSLSQVGLATMAMDRMYHLARSVLDNSGLGLRSFISEGTDNPEAPGWSVQRTLDSFPCYDPEVWAELLERTRRIHGELEKCEALMTKVSKSFPRNTTKEPL